VLTSWLRQLDRSLAIFQSILDQTAAAAAAVARSWRGLGLVALLVFLTGPSAVVLTIATSRRD